MSAGLESCSAGPVAAGTVLTGSVSEARPANKIAVLCHVGPLSARTYAVDDPLVRLFLRLAAHPDAALFYYIYRCPMESLTQTHSTTTRYCWLSLASYISLLHATTRTILAWSTPSRCNINFSSQAYFLHIWGCKGGICNPPPGPTVMGRCRKKRRCEGLAGWI